MGDTRKARYAAIGIGAIGLVAWTGSAFACTPKPAVYSVVPQSASPGETVVVSGDSVRSQVEIRWNGATGKVLATAEPTSSGAFSVPVKIPDVGSGIYSMTVFTANEGMNRTVVEVTGGDSSMPAKDTQLWPTLADANSSTGSTSSGVSPAGIALLSLGLVGLASGSAVAVARRRRVPVS